MSVCCPAVLLSLLSGLYRVHGLRVSRAVTLLADISCLLFLFRNCLFVVVVVVLFSLSSLPPYVFRFYLWLIGQFVPLLACLIRAAILNFSFRLHLFTSRCYVVLISDLLYQSAGIVFLDGGRVSEGLVMVSLAFHLFVVSTVIFASVLLWLSQVKNFFIPSKENVVPHVKPKRQCTYM